MPLAVGQTLSFYEILGPLGVGGMGEVYRAKDTRLDREVAIKVLPEELADDEERLRRFEREAKTLASLNHPNVAGIHGVDQDGDVCFLALELVPGEDLATRLSRGTLPVDEAIDVCRQIAEGLEAAHEAGVVHRDLKPANVRITPSGEVKVLDFGLAKPIHPKASKDGGTAGESDSFLMTADGVVLGTPTYMSPEQARGKPVDRRTDIWAFGCVLFECLTGKRAFDGEAMADVLGAIVGTEPDWSALPAATPSRLRALLERCLEKNPRKRLRDIGEARVRLEALVEDPGEAGQISIRPGGARALLPWGIAAVALVVAVAGFFAPEVQPKNEIVRMSLSAQFPANRGARYFALSPNGKLIAYGEEHAGSARLVLRPIDAFEDRPVVGGEEAVSPFFSPDGRRIAFFARGKLWSVDVAGGAPRSLCDVATSNSTGVWSDDGNIYFLQFATRTGVERVAEGGGVAEEVTQPIGSSLLLRPRLLPGGAGLSFDNINRGSWRTQLCFFDGSLELLIDRPQVTYLPDGRALFVEAGRLFAAEYDPSTYEITGTPVDLLADVVDYEVSPSGSLAYRSGPLERTFRFTRFRRDGTSSDVDEFEHLYTRPTVSPDGSTIAAISDEARGVHLWDAQRGTRRLLNEEGIYAQWGDENTIYYQTRGDRVHAIDRMPIDGSAGSERLLETEASIWPTDVSEDGRALLYYEIHPQTERDIWILPLEGAGSGQPRSFLATAASERSAVFSPDGRWIAYLSDITGRDEVFVRPASGEGSETRVTPDGGREPRWSRDGSELYFRKDDGLWAVPVTTETRFSVEEPVLLFRGDFLMEEGGRNQLYDVFPNGDFLVLQGPPKDDELRVVLNWFEEFGKELP